MTVKAVTWTPTSCLSLLLPWGLYLLLAGWRLKSLQNTVLLIFTATLIELTCFSTYSATVFLLNTSRDHSREETPFSTYIKQGSIGWGLSSTRWGILKDHDCVVANGSSRIILQKRDWSSNSILISPSLCWCGSRITAILSSAGGCTLFHCLRLKQPPGTVPVPEGRMLCLLRAKIHW